MAADDWQQYKTWHELLERLCVRAGYDDNAALASAYLQHSGNNGRDNHDAIQKNLRNWRLGRHLPLRRNVVVLAQLLGVDDDPELQQCWFSLYRAARGESEPEIAQHADLGGGAVGATPRRGSRHVWHWAAMAAVILITIAAGVHIYRWWQFGQLPLIGYDARVRILVGESRLIHGDRTECNMPAPDYATVAHRIPVSRLGSFSDGGIAKKMDNACGRVIAVRAARFTAEKAGSEEIELFGDFIKLEVTDAAAPAN